MPVKKVDISPEAAEVLRRGSWSGEVYILPQGQLERSLYAAVDKVLRALGGKWNRSAGGHIFSAEAKAALEAALAEGHVIDHKKSLEQFFTPQDLAKRMAAQLGIEPGMTILEPSAGSGRLVEQALARGAWVLAIELSVHLAYPLADLDPVGALRIFNADFMAWSPPEDADPIDRVLMNPPFSRNQDIAHVLRAYDFLRPGGRLMAVMSPHHRFAGDSASVEFRGFCANPARRAMWADLPPGTFKEAGTMIKAGLLYLEKPES